MMLAIQKKMTILLFSLFSMTALSVIMIMTSPTTSCEAFTSSSSSSSGSSSSSTMTARRMVASSSSSTTSSTEKSKSSSSSTLTLPKTQYPDPNLNNPWYSTKIQTDMSYSTKVKSLYLRHCVVERKETAELALNWYLQLTSGGSVENVGNSDGDDVEQVVIHTSRDPFGDVTKQLSACTMTREEGGKIGWVDIEVNKKSNELTYSSLIPSDILQNLIELQPKAGDVHIIGPSSSSNQVHLIRVEELYIPNIVLPTERKSLSTLTSSSSNSNGSKNEDKLGSFNGINALVSRNKLKGHGVMPTVPKFTKTQNKNGDSNDDTNQNQNQNQNPKKQRTYAIQTNGCQMNVADSERLEGILQNELGLQPINMDESYRPVNKVELNTADVIIFNTCSIRDHAEQKLYDALGPFRARKRQKQVEGDTSNSDFALIVTGCVAQQEGLRLLQKIPEIDVVLGPQYVPYLSEVLTKIEWGYQFCLTEPTIIIDNYKTNYDGSSSTTKTRTITPSSSIESSSIESSSESSTLTSTTATPSSSLTLGQQLPENDDFSSKPIRGHAVRAWVNVIYGCNEHCTYCVVPATRGMEQSRSMESILEECLDLINNRGYKEVTLLGQNIDAYGRDMVPKRSFADLLHYLNSNLSSITSKCRLRYVTSHPRYFSDRVIDAVSTLPSVCECFHMPFQAGDNDVLRRMRRGYTYESYMKIIHKIRTASPDAAITADVIVGFPGETEEAFQRTLDLMDEVKFDNLNSFAYSARPNTEAATWTNDDATTTTSTTATSTTIDLTTAVTDDDDGDDDDDDEDKAVVENYFVVPEEVKKERLARVQELAVRNGLERSQRYLGRVIEVLVEDKNSRNNGQVMGRTRQGRQVFFDGIIDELKGEFVNVEITEARTWSLMGRPITQ